MLLIRIKEGLREHSVRCPHERCEAVVVGGVDVKSLRDEVGDDRRVAELSGEVDAGTT